MNLIHSIRLLYLIILFVFTQLSSPSCLITITIIIFNGTHKSIDKKILASRI